MFIEKFGWGKEDAKHYNTLISSISVLGLAIGSLAAGKTIMYGRRRAILIFSTLAILGAALCQILTVATLTIGRLISGVAAGTLTVVLSKSLYESAPQELSGEFGAMANFYIAFSIFLASFSGVVLPLDKADFKDDENWRIVYACPLVLGVIQLLLFLFVYKQEPILFSIGKNQDGEARKMVKRLFTFPSAQNEEEKDKIADEYIKELRDKSDSTTSKVTFKQAICDPQYRKATWICVIIGFLNKQCGIDGLAVFFTRLVGLLSEQGSFPLRATHATAIYSFSDFVGGCIGYFLLKMLGRKTVMIGGQIGMVVFQFVAGLAYMLGYGFTTYLCAVGFVITFAATQGPVAWLYIAEVTVDQAMGVVMLALYASSLQQVLQMEFLMDSPATGGPSGIFWLFSFENFVHLVFVIFVVKETKGLTDQQKKALYLPKNKDTAKVEMAPVE